MQDLHGATFLKGAAKLSQLPPDIGAEVAFAGRSNAGKSSVLNKLVGARALARTSKTPGRTREVNFFALDDGHRLVDLPGYGYAKVPQTMKRRWGTLLEGYLRERRSLAGVIVIMDVRRPFTRLDENLVSYCVELGLEVHALLTKCDKLSRGRALEVLRAAEQQAADLPGVSLQLFSAVDGTGIDEARAKVAAWLAAAGSGGEKKPRLHNRGGGIKPGP